MEAKKGMNIPINLQTNKPTRKSGRDKTLALHRHRIIGIFAHVDAGKTTTSEAILFYTGKTHNLGRVDEGNTVLDWMQSERERGITITSAATSCEWNAHRISLIDTPGHIDFTAEVVRSIRVIDSAIILLCGVGGIEPQTESVWMQAEQERLPRVIFVNKLDRVGADFFRVVEEVHERFSTKAIATQVPIGKEEGFHGVVDLLTLEALIWQPGEIKPEKTDIPEELKAEIEEKRALLIEAICETDDELLEHYLSGNYPEIDRLKQAFREAVLSNKLIPILCGATLNRIGVEPLLNTVVDYLPSPADEYTHAGFDPEDHDMVTEIHATNDDPLAAYVFKIVTDPHVGSLTWVRVFSGAFHVGGTLINPRTGDKERVSRIYRIHANKRESVDKMVTGDVVALVGLKNPLTGDTLCQEDRLVVMGDMEFPDPVISIALSLPQAEDSTKLHQAVAKLCSEDPTLTNSFDHETEELILNGLGELHLEVTVERLKNEFNIEPIVSPPLVSYGETIVESREENYTYKKQSGGHGHFAQVIFKMEPLPRGEGFIFENRAPAQEIPGEFIPHVEQGFKDTMEKGVFAGFPMSDIKVTLTGGKHHKVDSAPVDFRLAASMALRHAIKKTPATLLEPIMKINISVDEQYLGAVIGDLGKRRGNTKSMDLRGNRYYVVGEVPLAEVCGYATVLRGLTQGRSSFTLEINHYDIVPESIASEVIKDREEKGKVNQRISNG